MTNDEARQHRRELQVTAAFREGRRAACAEQYRLFPDYAMLPEICINLRMAMNGAGDPLDHARVLSTLAMLRQRLLWWEEGPVYSQGVDDAVRALVSATLAEVER